MKNQLITLILFSIISLKFGASAIAAEKDSEAVRAATDKFYSALNTMFTGELGPMKDVWSHKEDVTYMGPQGGFDLGWKKILPVWEKQAALKLGGKVEPKDIQITVGHDLAFVSNYEIGQNITDGKPQKVTIRATSMFRNEDGKWKMIGHHTDLLPFLQK